jgi:hypothetical protein
MEDSATMLVNFFEVSIPVLLTAVSSEDEDRLGDRGWSDSTLSTATEFLVNVFGSPVLLTDDEFWY